MLLFLLIIITKLIEWKVVFCNRNLSTQITIPYTARRDELKIKLYLGNQDQHAYLNIDIGGKFPLISKTLYQKSISNQSTLLRNETINIDGIKLDSQVISDKVSVKENEYYSFLSFYVADIDFRSSLNLLPLSYKYNDINFSLIHSYKRAHILSYASFTIESDKNIYLGLQTDELDRKKMKYKGKCDVDKNKSFWGCHFKGIKSNNQYYKDNEYVSFSTTTHMIAVPESIMKFLFYSVFEEYIKKDICSYNVYNKPKASSFSCMCNLINESFPNISLFFDDYEFIISYPDLFERIYNSCIFIFKYDSTLSSDYTIGLNFIYHYLTKFDYEDNTISFYSDVHEIIRHSTRDEIIYPVCVLYFIISLILISGVFYLSLYKYFTNKKENSNTINI